MTEHHEFEIDIEDDLTVYGSIIVRKVCPHPEIVRTPLIDESAGIMLSKYGR